MTNQEAQLLNAVQELYTEKLTELEGEQGRWQLAYDHIAENTKYMGMDELKEDAMFQFNDSEEEWQALVAQAAARLA